MKIKINSYIVGLSQPPGTILVVGEDITEEQATTLIGMGKEVERVPEGPAGDQNTGAPAGTPNEELPPWFGMPGTGQRDAGNPTNDGNGRKRAADRAKGGRTAS